MLRILFFTDNTSRCRTELLTRASAQIVHVAPVDFLRSVVRRYACLDTPTKQTDLANYIHNNWSNEEALAPLITEYVAYRLQQCAGEAAVIVVVDGFPRTVAQCTLCVAVARHAAVLVVSHEEKLRDEIPHELRRHDDGATPVADILQHIEQQQPRPSSLSTVDKHHPLLAMGFVRASSSEQAQIVQMQLRLANCSGRKRQFIGSHPVSLDRDLMPRLLRYPYVCALKLDGERMMCLMRDQRLFFLTRTLDVYKSDAAAVLHDYDDSLLDGQLCAEERTFVVLDALAVGGNAVSRRPIMERIAHCLPIVRHLYNAALRFRCQEYVDRTQLQQLLERSFDKYRREPDGIVFQPARLPARTGIDFNQFKWKPLLRLTADLLYAEDGRLYARKTASHDDEDERVTLEGDSGLMLVEASPSGTPYPHIHRPQWLRAGAIVECVPVFDEAAVASKFWWMPSLQRTDKLFPNMDWLVDKIVRSIDDNVTESELIEFCERPPLAPSQVPSPPPIRRSRRDRREEQ